MEESKGMTQFMSSYKKQVGAYKEETKASGLMDQLQILYGANIASMLPSQN